MTASFIVSEKNLSFSIAPRLLTALLLITIPLLFFYPALLGQVVLMPGDGWVQNFGVRALTGQMLASGQWPLWNPYIFAGTPLLASVYPGVLYPPNWLFAVLPPVAAMNAVVILSYELAIIGSYLYARKIGSSRTGAIIGASLFTLGGFMIVHLGHTSRIAAAAWLPWVLLALEQLYRTTQWRWVVLGAVFLGLQFVAGEPQMTFHTALVCGLYVAFCLLFRRESTQRVRFVLYGFVMALCGALFSLALYVPARELQQQSARAQLDYTYFAAFSLPPKQLIAFIFPYFFGGGGIVPYLQAAAKSSFWGETSVNVSAGYMGLLGLMLALLAIFRFRRNAMICFWAVVALLALVLALGDYLPFGLNHLLYQIPVYNLFRGSYRHLFEYTFAVAMLAGLGATELVRLGKKARQLLVTVISTLMGVVVGTIAILYCFFLDRFPAASPRLKEFGQLSNPEAFVPILCFVAGVSCLWLYARHPTLTTKTALIVIAVADVSTFGWFFEWHNTGNALIARIPDAATVKFIKSQENDFNAFRIVSHGAIPFSYNYEELNFPNNSMMRGLQSVNGYDVLQLERFKNIAGNMTTEGNVQDRNAFSAAHRGFDLLNVKYFLRERKGASLAGRTLTYAGIQFAETPVNLKLARGDHFEAAVKAVPATEIAFVSTLANSVDLTDNTPLLKIRLHTTDQKIIERALLVGRDSSEWAYDRPDVKASIKHQRATVVESYPAEGFEGHRYLARFQFERAEITRVEIDFAAPSAEIVIARAALHDETSGSSTQIDNEELAPERWRKLETFGDIEIYENLRRLPRAWLAEDLQVKSRDEVVQAIQTGQFKDGTLFDPQKTALLEIEDFGGKEFLLPPVGKLNKAAVQLTQYTPQHIQIETDHNAPSFLVLSEIYYRGWDARIDGAKASVYRVNHTLRGLAVPAGKHRIEFVYRAPSLKTGLLYSALGALILLIGSVVSVLRVRPENQATGLWTRLKTNLRLEFTSLRAQLSAHDADKLVISRATLRRAFMPLMIGVSLFALLHIYVNNRFAFEPIRSDGVGYYIYLPAAFIHHDLSLATTIERQFAGKTEEWMGIFPYPATGRYLNRYALGEAILLSPFFWFGHGLAKALSLPTNGFSWPYQLATVFAGLAYFIAGLALLQRVLERHFSTTTTLLSLVVITFGTNLFHYGTSDNIFSHVYSFCLFSALLFLTEKWYETAQRWPAILLAIVAGLITIVRPTNVIMLIVVPLLGISSRVALRERLLFLRRHLVTVLLCLGIYGLTILPLLSYWKYTTGHWIVNSYQGFVFNWTRPELINVLFSVRKGLLFWSPILLLSLIGFYFVARYWKGFLLPAIVVITAHTYVVASWPAWWFGGSFGHRAFTEILPLFAVGYAALLEATRQKPRIYRGLLAVSAGLVLLSVKFMIQYWNGILPYDESTLEILATTFFQFAK